MAVTTESEEPTRSEYIEVRQSPMDGGKGMFAVKHILKGTRIIRYVGRKILKDEADDVFQEQFDRHQESPESNGAVYLFELNKKYDLDGNVPWNTARFINHSCSPNCETENTGNHIWVVSLRDIKKDEEICYDYGFDVDSYEDHPCKCGSKNCVGFIVSKEQWPRLKRLLAKK